MPDTFIGKSSVRARHGRSPGVVLRWTKAAEAVLAVAQLAERARGSICGARWARWGLPVATTALLLAGCSGMMKQWAQNEQRHDERQAEGIDPVKRAFAQDDGYTVVDPADVDSVFHPAIKGHKTKFCQAPGDFLTPNREMAGMKDEAAMFKKWMAEGKVPSDRYYFALSVHVLARKGDNVEDVYFSIPLSERDELWRNVDAAPFACFWMDGQFEQLPEHEQRKSPVLHFRVAKWDGVLRPHAPPAAATSDAGAKP